jgi:periplasmic protein TonB
MPDEKGQSKQQTEQASDFRSGMRTRLAPEERRDQKWAFSVACLFHAILLYMIIPSCQGIMPAPPVQEYVRIKPYRPPKPKVTPPPEKRIKEKKKPRPIPNPNPEEPEQPPEFEIIYEDDFDDLDTDDFDDYAFGIPDAIGPPITFGWDEAPQAVHEVRPEYPELLKKQRIEGVVVLEVLIRRDGTIDPDQVKVIRSSHPFFTESVMKVVNDMRFSPPKRQGKPVDILYALNFRFKLSEYQ